MFRLLFLLHTLGLGYWAYLAYSGTAPQAEVAQFALSALLVTWPMWILWFASWWMKILFAPFVLGFTALGLLVVSYMHLDFVRESYQQFRIGNYQVTIRQVLETRGRNMLEEAKGRGSVALNFFRRQGEITRSRILGAPERVNWAEGIANFVTTLSNGRFRIEADKIKSVGEEN